MKNIVFLVSVCVLLVISCKKKDKTTVEEPQTTGTTTGLTTPQAPNLFISVPSDANGVLIASRVPKDYATSTTLVGNASAFFYTAPGNYNYQDAGTVKCNDSVLVKLTGGSYMFNGKGIEFQTYSGINYSGGSRWAVTGNAAPAISYTSGAFPTDAVLTSSNLLNKNSNYNFSLSGVNNADSIAIYLLCDSQTVRKTIAGNATTTTFLASQIASTKKAGSTNKGYFNIIPYSLKNQTFSSKKYYFVNATTSTWTVTIQ